MNDFLAAQYSFQLCRLPAVLPDTDLRPFLLEFLSCSYQSVWLASAGEIVLVKKSCFDLFSFAA